MGFPIATRLAATRDLVVWDQSPSAREAIGALDRVVVASGLDALAAGHECVVMMLPDSAAVSAVVAALRPRMRPGTLLIDMGSSDPTVTRSIAGALEGEQIEFVDAPVSGGVAGAERGTLSTMVGGSEEAVRRARPLLEAVTSTLIHVGEVGSGHAVKALNNLLSATGMLITAEALKVGSRFGIDEGRMLEAFNASSGRNYATERKFPDFILPGGFDSGFRLGLMRKDVETALSLAAATSTEAPLGKVCGRLWEQADELLGGQVDHTEFVHLYERSPSLE